MKEHAEELGINPNQIMARGWKVSRFFLLNRVAIPKGEEFRMSTEEKMEQLLNDYGNFISRMCFLDRRWEENEYSQK